MALKEFNEYDFQNQNLVSMEQAKEKLDKTRLGIKVVYTNEEFDGAYSSQLSKEDWEYLKSSLANPTFNEKLADLLKM